MSGPVVRMIETPRGPAGVTVVTAGPDWLVLGHGAGGSTWSADVLAAREAAVEAGWSVALVDQPWRVAGRRVADRPPVLDAAWLPVVDDLRAAGPRRLVTGGRSAGARVAARTAAATGADAVLALSFPLHPPGRPESSRAPELAEAVAAGALVHIVQGARDPFGHPAEVRAAAPPGVEVVEVPGTHTLTDPGAVARAVTAWLDRLPNRRGNGAPGPGR